MWLQTLKSKSTQLKCPFQIFGSVSHFTPQAGSKLIKNVPVVTIWQVSTELAEKDRFSGHVKKFSCSELILSKNCKNTMFIWAGNVQTFQTPLSNLVHFKIKSQRVWRHPLCLFTMRKKNNFTLEKQNETNLSSRRCDGSGITKSTYWQTD